LDDASSCNRSYFCGLSSALRGIQASFDESLQSVTLASLAIPDRERRAKAAAAPAK
jgi:DNA-binding IscR family transcriptional regulator